MKVFRVRCDVNNFQIFHLVGAVDYFSNPYKCIDLSPKASTWVPPEVYIDQPLAKRGDFFEFWDCSAFAISPRAFKVLKDILLPAGELLPLIHEGVEYKVFHVVERFDCIDKKRCPDWEDQMMNSEPKLVFKPKLLPPFSIFKFEGDAVDYYVIERTGDPKTEFKAAVEHHGLTGLKFIPVTKG